MSRGGGTAWRRGTAGLLLALACAAHPALAQTPAGTQIVNTARLTADTPAVAIDSNSVAMTVGAVIDAAIVAERATQGPGEVAFTIRNPGNAAAAFAVDATIAGQPARVTGDGPIELAPGETRRVVVMVQAVTVPVIVEATVTAVRGHGAPGTAIDETTVIGISGARASASTQVVPATAAAQLEKAQAVRAPDGSARAVAGAVITYTLVARFARGARAARVTDLVPEGTIFVPDSLVLDDQPVGDGFADGRVQVALGDVAGGATHTIRFQAVIQ